MRCGSRIVGRDAGWGGDFVLYRGKGRGERFWCGCWRGGVGVGFFGVGVDVVFEADPSDDCGGKDEVEEAFVGYGKDHEDWTEGEEDDG